MIQGLMAPWKAGNSMGVKRRKLPQAALENGSLMNVEPKALLIFAKIVWDHMIYMKLGFVSNLRNYICAFTTFFYKVSPTICFYTLYLWTEECWLGMIHCMKVTVTYCLKNTVPFS